MQMSIAVEEFAKKLKGKEGLAVSAFSQALKALPIIIAENGGFDSAELIQNLKSQILAGKSNVGLDMNKGAIGDMKEIGVLVNSYPILY